jgi:hypothetical protein
VTSMGPSPVRGFIAAIAHPCLVVFGVLVNYPASAASWTPQGRNRRDCWGT